MKIYDELTNAEIITPNTDLGYLYSGTRFVGHTEDAYEVMEGTVTEDCPDGLQRFIPGHDLYEDCQYYHAYTEEELAERGKPTLQETLQEQVDANAAAILELAQMLAGGE